MVKSVAGMQQRRSRQGSVQAQQLAVGQWTFHSPATDPYRRLCAFHVRHIRLLGMLVRLQSCWGHDGAVLPGPARWILALFLSHRCSYPLQRLIQIQMLTGIRLAQQRVGQRPVPFFAAQVLHVLQ